MEIVREIVSGPDEEQIVIFSEQGKIVLSGDDLDKLKSLLGRA